MISFEHPSLLYLLLLIPAITGLWFLTRWARVRKLRKFGNPDVLANLMPDASKYMPGVKLAVEMVAIAAIVIALARPVANIGDTSAAAEEAVKSRGIEIMVCFDVSNSMRASSTDNPNGISRLDKAKHILEKLIDKMGNDKIGLIVFAGDAYTQLPITSDYVSAKMFLESISTGMVPTQGTAIGAAIEMAAASFSPDDKFPKAIVVITDGENFEDNAADAAKSAARNGIRVDVIGVGTTEGAPIPVNSSRTEFMRDNDGKEVITALNEEMAQEIAQAGDGIYISGNNPNAVGQLDDNLSELGEAEFTRITRSPAAEQFNLLAWIALILVIVDMFTLNRKISWLRRFTFFTKKTEKK